MYVILTVLPRAKKVQKAENICAFLVFFVENFDFSQVAMLVIFWLRKVLSVM